MTYLVKVFSKKQEEEMNGFGLWPLDSFLNQAFLNRECTVLCAKIHLNSYKLTLCLFYHTNKKKISFV